MTFAFSFESECIGSVIMEYLVLLVNPPYHRRRSNNHAVAHIRVSGRQRRKLTIRSIRDPSRELRVVATAAFQPLDLELYST